MYRVIRRIRTPLLAFLFAFCFLLLLFSFKYVMKAGQVSRSGDFAVKQDLDNETFPVIKDEMNYEFLQAEKDSNERKKQKEKTCKEFYKQPANLFDHRSWNKQINRETFNVLRHLIVSKKHKVIYCFIPKIACSNTKKIFLVLNEVYPNITHVNGNMLHEEIERLAMDNKLTALTRGQVFNMLQNYYKFMLVRDPFERLVATYRQKFYKQTTFTYYTKVGKDIASRYHSKNLDNTTVITFTEFVRNIVDNPSEQLDEHWMPYNDLCRPCDINYDFIGSIDTLSRDVTHAMRQINVDETKYYLTSAGKGALVGTKNVTAKFLKQLPEKVFNALVEKFRLDHQLFGYAIPDYGQLHERFN